MRDEDKTEHQEGNILFSAAVEKFNGSKNRPKDDDVLVGIIFMLS